MWQSVDRPSPDACWNWLGARSASGHGLVKVAGCTRYVHRYVFELFCGPIPAGMVIRHVCDNPGCCNPRHLILGTPRQNVEDRQQRGRSAAGEHNGRSVLTAEQVTAIYRRWHLGEGSTRLAREYHVDDRLIRQIVHHQRWTCLRLDQLDIPRPRLYGKEINP